MPATLASLNLPAVTAADLEVFAEDLDLKRACAIYEEYGCLVVRGLSRAYVDDIARDAETVAQQAIRQSATARKIPEGWVTHNGTLMLPAPENFDRDKQIMVLGMNYTNSAAFFHSAFDRSTVRLVEAIIGPNVEMFMNGQSLYKEPVGGHPKKLHQDGAYFEHAHQGPVAALHYVVDTNLENGALHVIPGSHKLGIIGHVDTFSHLGLDEGEWPWELALPICGQKGDAIFFGVKTIHGSKENFSKAARPVFINRYRSVDDYVVVGGTSTANRKARDGVKEKPSQERGFMVCGFRQTPDEPAS